MYLIGSPGFRLLCCLVRFVVSTVILVGCSESSCWSKVACLTGRRVSVDCLNILRSMGDVKQRKRKRKVEVGREEVIVEIEVRKRMTGEGRGSNRESTIIPFHIPFFVLGQG